MKSVHGAVMLAVVILGSACGQADGGEQASSGSSDLNADALAAAFPSGCAATKVYTKSTDLGDAALEVYPKTAFHVTGSDTRLDLSPQLSVLKLPSSGSAPDATGSLVLQGLVDSEVHVSSDGKRLVTTLGTYGQRNIAAGTYVDETAFVMSKRLYDAMTEVQAVTDVTGSVKRSSNGAIACTHTLTAEFDTYQCKFRADERPVGDRLPSLVSTQRCF